MEKARSLYHIKPPKKIIQYSLNGEFIKIYDSLSQASNTLKINLSSLSLHLQKKHKTAGNFIWKYYKENFPITIDPVLKNKSSKKHILQYSKDGLFIKDWSSISEAAKSVNGDRTNLCSCARNEIKTAHGFVWKYQK